MSRSPIDYVMALTVASVAALGGAAIVFGEIDDAPGAMLIGMLLIIGAAALDLRTARRAG